jgi:hypothetical protein
VKPNPDDTSESHQSQDSDEREDGTSEPPPEQKQEIKEVTTTLSEVAEEVPEELAPIVKRLATTVDAAEDPDTSPQDREGVVESTEELAATLEVIGDPRTPRELRGQLVEIVEQVTSTLAVTNDPEIPSEQRSMIILTMQRVTSALDMICDRETPQGLRGDLITIAGQVSLAVEQSQGEQSVVSVAMVVGASMEIIQDEMTLQSSREQLAKSTRQVSRLLEKSSDPRASHEERSQARKALKDRTSRLKDEQEEAATAAEGGGGEPDESLGKAAEVCINAIFKAVPEPTLINGLKGLVPAKWRDEGVKDFWKSKVKSDELLDVLAQLRNDQQDHAEFKVVPLVTELAQLVPREELFSMLTVSALSCEQTASYLDEEFGITVGTWLTEADG